MAPTAEEKARFGQRLRELREAKDLSADELAAALTASGHKVTGSAVNAWERGEYAPRKRATLVAVDEFLDANDELVLLLGLRVMRIVDGTRAPALQGADEVHRLVDRLPLEDLARIKDMAERLLGEDL